MADLPSSRLRLYKLHVFGPYLVKMEREALGIIYKLVIMFTCDADVKVPLKAVVGSSITFPNSVKEKAFILLGTTNLASVSNGAFEIYEDIYTNRLHWSSSTGLFTLSHLQQNDSGVYTIDSKKGNVLKKIYELKLYEAVSAPVVSSVNVSADSCTVQCSVKHTEQTTLSWFRGEQPVDSSTSAVLLLTVQLQDYTSQYRCVAQNPADNKAVIVNITTVCEHKETLSDTSSGSKAVYIVIPIVLTVLIIIIMAFVLYVIKKCSKKESTPLQTEVQRPISSNEKP
ncbi:uncharacterized protein [Eucyclogobius newberryi]|uniref:uncharacterized protein n=1 Tax=Eucyclogobius newberryi TaxID=166745 RepID=UPI003B595A7B